MPEIRRERHTDEKTPDRCFTQDNSSRNTGLQKSLSVTVTWNYCNCTTPAIIQYNTIQDAILTCARKPPWDSLTYPHGTIVCHCHCQPVTTFLEHKAVAFPWRQLHDFVTVYRPSLITIGVHKQFYNGTTISAHQAIFPSPESAEN